jgi:hypothetical protein
MAAPFLWATPVSGFEWLRRLMGYARFWVSMAAPFDGLRPFLSFNGCAVSMGFARFWV